MKMPLTAIVFSIEALSCSANLLPIIATAATAYAITEIFGVHSINETVLERKIENLNESKAAQVIDTFVTVQEDSFAVGKQIRDIFWPANLFVLSVKRDVDRKAEMDERGDKILHAGDVLHVRYETYTPQETKDALYAIVGDQQSQNPTEIWQIL